MKSKKKNQFGTDNLVFFLLVYSEAGAEKTKDLPTVFVLNWSSFTLTESWFWMESCPGIRTLRSHNLVRVLYCCRC